MLIAYSRIYLLLEMSQYNYAAFQCLASNILREDWYSFSPVLGKIIHALPLSSIHGSKLSRSIRADQ